MFGAFSSRSDSNNAEPADTETTPTPIELLTDRERAVTGEYYHEEFLPENNADANEVISSVKDPTADDGEDVVAGPWARELIETHALSEDEPVWLGWMLDNQQREPIGIKLSEMARHMWLPGTSGAGKSTLFEIIKMQLAERGLGFLDFDPKGKDSRELLAKLPEHRLDDVVFVDPIDPTHEKTIGLNFLEIPEYIIEQGEQAVDREIAARKSIIFATFEQDDQLYATMKFIITVLAEAFMRANVRLIRNGGDPSEQYAFIDFFMMVLNATTRENFAEEVDDPFLRSAVQRVSEMPDDETLPTLKRVIPWVLSRLTRKIIAHRESTIDFREIIEEDKIVIVRTAIESEDIQQMITLGVMRMVWSAVQRRARSIDGTPKPYFIFADEFQKIASEQLDMDTMLEQARSMNLGVMIAHQFPSQIKTDHEDTYKAITNNAQTIAAFRSLERADAREVMSRFTDFDVDDLLETDDHEIWTKIALSDGTVSKGLKLNTFAPYPKLRTKDEIDRIIAERLDETGVEPLSTTEIIQQMPYQDPYGVMGAVIEGDVRTGEGAVGKKSGGIKREVARAVFHEGIFRGQTLGVAGEEWWINADRDVKERADRYVYGGVDTEAKFHDLLDNMDGGRIKLRQNDGRQVTITDNGWAELFVTGDSQTGGKKDHRDLAKDSVIALLRLGLEADVVQQSGGRDADGVVRIRELRETGVPKGVSPGALGRLERQRYEQMEDEHPFLTWLTDGADCTIEFEKSTAGRKSIVNWIKAYNAGEVCLFTARPAEAQRVWNAVADPVAVKSVEDETVRYYNHTHKISIGGQAVVIEDAETAQWSYDEEFGEYVLADENGTVRARFDTHHEIVSNKSKYDGVSGDYDDAELGENGPHLTANMPIVPEREFDIESRDELDPEADVRVIETPENIYEDERPIKDILSLVRGDGATPLSAVEDELFGDGSTTENSTDETDDDEDDYSSLFVGDRRRGSNE